MVAVAGDEIEVRVEFDFDVVAHADRGVPRVYLNLGNASRPAAAVLTSLGVWSTTHTFVYRVRDGDDAGLLDVRGAGARPGPARHSLWETRTGASGS